MATAANATHPVGIAEPLSLGRRFLALIPGLLLLTAVGYAGKFIEQSIAVYTKSHHITFPNIEYVLWAILIGLAISNTLSIPKIFRAGIATYEFWLKLGIVLLGARFVVADVLKLGGISLALVVIEITLSLALMTFLGKLFGLKPKLISLLQPFDLAPRAIAPLGDCLLHSDRPCTQWAQGEQNIRKSEPMDWHVA